MWRGFSGSRSIFSRKRRIYTSTIRGVTKAVSCQTASSRLFRVYTRPGWEARNSIKRNSVAVVTACSLRTVSRIAAVSITMSPARTISLVKAAKDSFYTRDYFLRTERLRDVIIRANFKSAQPVRFRSACCNKNNWNAGQRRVVADRLGHVQPAVPRNHDVENHQRRAASMHFIEQSSAGRKPRDPVARRLQMMFQQARNIGIVFE